MPRIRSIKPEFWEDETVGLLSREARLLFIACWNAADDQGLLRWAPPYLKATAFIYDDDIEVEDVARFMEELEEAGVIFPYHGGKTSQKLAYVINFHRHQVINRPSPSKLPAPSLQNTAVRRMYATRDGWVCHICKEPVDSRTRTTVLQPAIDHIMPRFEGGSDYPSNLALSHKACNSRKGHSIPDELLIEEGRSELPEEDPEVFMETFSESSLQEGKGRERERKGREVVLLAPKPARDEVWDTLADLFGEATTRSNQGLRGNLVKSLATAGADASEIRLRVQAWPFHFPDATLTETALEKHWDRLGKPPARMSKSDIEKYQSEIRRFHRRQEIEGPA